MAKAKIKWRNDAFKEIRTLPAVLAEVDKLAERVQAAAGVNYHTQPATTTGGRVRGRAAVVTTGIEGAREEARSHRLVAAMATVKGV